MESKNKEIRNTTNQEMVIALHCSGGSARQWRLLSEALGAEYVLETPSHIDSCSAAIDFAADEFTLANEAAQSIQLIDQFSGKVHLVGHSYGGGVALGIAMARPERIASLTLYEPCIFHILPYLDPTNLSATKEIRALANSIKRQVAAKDARGAMREFVNYWGGPVAWQSLRQEHQEYLMAWSPKAILEFDALFRNRTSLHDYRNLPIPINLLLGEHSPTPTKAISHALANLLPDCQFERLTGMGHMGPVTHADTVAQLVAAHITRNSACALSGSQSTTSTATPTMEVAA